MENYSYRSKSCREVEIRSKNYGVPTSMQELRSYSTTVANYNYSADKHPREHQIEIKKGKKGSNFGKFASSSSRSWSFLSDPELQRKRRFAGYKLYAVEGNMKGSLKRSFRWIKHTYNQVVYGCS